MKITEKYVLNLILSIILVFSVIGATAVFFVDCNLLNADKYIEISDEKNIPKMAYNEINQYFTDGEDYSKIPADVYMSVITEDDVKELIDLKINSVVSYMNNGSEQLSLKTEYDYTDLKNSITDYFNKFAEENNVEINDYFNTQLEKTISTAISEIESFTDIYMFEIVDKTGMLQKINKVSPYINPIKYVLMGAAVLLVVLIVFASRKNICNILYWIGIPTLAVGVLVLVPSLYLKITGIAEKFIIRNDCVYTAYTGFMNDIIISMMITGLVILLISVCVLFAGAFISKKKKSE